MRERFLWSLAVVMAGALACRGAPPVHVRCDPGGLCASPVAEELRAAATALGLPDLSTQPIPGTAQEIRIWTSEHPASAGTLSRFRVDGAGNVVAENVSWFASTDSVGGSGGRGTGPFCQAHRTSDQLFEVCSFERLVAPYTANQLRALEARGIWDLPGSGAPLETRCAEHICFQPGWIIVELRREGEYRSYGYPLHASPTAQESATRLLAPL